jgi:hypothetical protein
LSDISAARSRVAAREGGLVEIAGSFSSKDLTKVGPICVQLGGGSYELTRILSAPVVATLERLGPA